MDVPIEAILEARGIVLLSMFPFQQKTPTPQSPPPLIKPIVGNAYDSVNSILARRAHR
jgi:hypothetical protein